MNQESSTASADAIDAATLRDRLAGGERVHLLDVRNRSEIDEWRIDAPERSAIPYMRFVAAGATDSVADLASDLPEEVVVVCPQGEASDEVAAMLREEGVDAINLAGGMEGWARLYEVAELDVDSNATVLQYLRPSSGCLAYLVVSDGEAGVIDPLRAFAERYLADARALGAELAYALDTHVHADHVSGVRELSAAGVEPVLPSGAVDRGLADAEAFTLLAPGETLDVGGITVEAIAAPGHTTEMTAYRVSDLLLTGDGLFVERVPRPDLERDARRASERASGRSPRAADDDGAREMARDLHATLTERFADLPDDLTVAPGHVEPDVAATGPFVAALGDLRERLPAFEQDREAFVEFVLDRMGARPANYEEIIAVNLGREDVDDETAFELELGPNNCAAG
ncbi:MBL fold metallo-hydrolase [Halomarina halobia]|uniref:MBL fold metallo-hydrolase n=1 Tax=Halomarina halobia TaxID=3033386 RepID=A0ABD6AA48_9EURY|nr:MBL fold metallo-hydrolase [Halomarina sp. PSR21]